MQKHIRDKTQEGRILKRLLEARGAEVPDFELGRISLQYGSRIHGLRKAGFRIENRLERHGKQRRGFYRLVMNGFPEQYARASEPANRGENSERAEVRPLLAEPMRCWAGDE